jgi:hypothetical protein
MDRNLEPGAVVVFVDENRRRHNALVTEAHGDSLGRVAQYKKDAEGKVVYDDNGRYPVEEGHGPIGENWPCVNLTFVSSDPRKTDTYGRQIERDSTSVPYLDDSTAAGYCFFFVGEEERADEKTRLAFAEAAKRHEDQVGGVVRPSHDQ